MPNIQAGINICMSLKGQESLRIHVGVLKDFFMSFLKPSSNKYKLILPIKLVIR